MSTARNTPSENHPAVLSVPEAIARIRDGEMVIVVDDEDRENEGDLTMAADLVTPEAINFMATFGRGLICLTLSEDTVERLRLPMMTSENRSARGTAFTASIDAREGITTGISARERAQTCRIAVDPRTRPEDLVMPGHVFPLRARRGGTLVRSGHTEAANDLARLAGRDESGVICEIMRDDGEMARMPDLENFAEQHGLGIVRIADLIQYRLEKERLVEQVGATTLCPLGCTATFQATVHRTTVDETEYLALVLGAPKPDKPTLVRVQTAALLPDVFGATFNSSTRPPNQWLNMIEQAGEGVFLYVVNPRSIRLSEGFPGVPAPAASAADEDVAPLRDFGLGAQVLAQLGVGKIHLLTNRPRKIAGLEGYGIQVESCVGSPNAVAQ